MISALVAVPSVPFSLVNNQRLLLFGDTVTLQAGNKHPFLTELRFDFYLVAPESCVNDLVNDLVNDFRKETALR